MSRRRREGAWTRYHEGTRRVSVSFALLLPLLALYEVGVFLSGGHVRNAAEMTLKHGTGSFGIVFPWVQHLLLLAVLVVAVQVYRRGVPLLRWFPFLLIESFAFAFLLGPVVSELVQTAGLSHERGPDHLSGRLLLSIGAGVYEELLFRFLILAGGFSLMHRVGPVARRPAIVVAVVVSAAAFAAYHHLGPSGESWEAGPLAFRFFAGMVLGTLFVWRGLAVCVYLHAQYDVLCDLRLAEILS